MNTENISIVAALVYLSIVLALVAGWVMNIITIFSDFDVFSTGEAVIRIAGIIIPIIGGVMGWL